MTQKPLPNCNHAAVNLWQDAKGEWWETFSFPAEVAPNTPKIDNKIIRPGAASQTPPGKVMFDRGLCFLPAPTSTAQGVPLSITATDTDLGVDGDGSGAFLLVFAIAAAAGIAYLQKRYDKADFDDDYHPMSDVPTLPAVATDENLDILYGHVGHPNYQGIREPNPFYSTQIFPTSQPPTEPHINTPPPDSTYVPPVDSTPYAASGEAVVDSEETFFAKWLPAPAKGYYLDEESLLSNTSQAQKIVRDAIRAGVSTNKLCRLIFKISKNTKKHALLTELIARVEREASDE